MRLERETMNYKVLLAEDNHECRDLFALTLQHLGYQVLQADDGDMAVKKALSEKPDLILMDLSMRNMNGIEATNHLRANSLTKHTPIIICTGWLARQYRETAMQSGAQEVVTKPVSMKDLASLLTRYLPTPASAVAH
jgi:two-component system cell cycle response regulator DivK